jgi:16S rRNA processing protein RimM
VGASTAKPPAKNRPRKARADSAARSAAKRSTHAAPRASTEKKAGLPRQRGKPARASAAATLAPAARRAVARIRRPFGIHGAVLLDLLTENPDLLLTEGGITLGEHTQPLVIERLARHGQDTIAQLAGCHSLEQAEQMRGEILWLRADLLPALPAGVYYHYQILGLQVVTDDGRALGRVAEILKTGANDVYVVRGEGGEILLPAIESVIRGVSLEDGSLTVHLIEGLLPAA